MENGVEAKRVKMDDGSLFGHLDIYPPDPIFHVKDAYLADKSPSKVNLGIGGMNLWKTNGGGALDSVFFSQRIVQKTVSHGCCPW